MEAIAGVCGLDLGPLLPVLAAGKPLGRWAERGLSTTDLKDLSMPLSSITPPASYTAHQPAGSGGRGPRQRLTSLPHWAHTLTQSSP